MSRTPAAQDSSPPPVAHAAGRGGPTDPSHDDLLRRGILHTEVGRGVALLLVGAFAALIAIMPLLQLALEKAHDEEPLLLELFQHLPNEERLRQFEDSLEETSYAKSFVQPRAQTLLTRFGRGGNKKAAVGREGLLYYVPGITHLAGPGFLSSHAIDGRQRSARLRGAEVPAPDPRPAILEFHELLRSRGIELVLFPVPDKAMVEPQGLHARDSSRVGAPIANNQDFSDFVAEMTSRGVRVFDPTPKVRSAERKFLIQDTHWTPRWMEQVARELSEFVKPSLPPVPAPSWKRVATRVERVGDITDMLKLPEQQSLFPKEAVTVQTVKGEEDALWESDPKADVLLLGDSFTNVFTLDYMGWGEAAGLAPQLAFALGRGVDVLAQNDAGAHATRRALETELRSGEDRLAGKKVVIWEFAARELSVGDWKHIDWSFARKAAAP
jgi:alginate O-acetyltransferase complex protein AlgJ